MADGFLQYVLSGRDRSVLRRVLTWLVSFFSSELRSDRVCDGLLENGRMRVFFTPHGMVITQSFNGAADTGLDVDQPLCKFWFFEIPRLPTPLPATRNRALGYFPGHHDRVFHARRGERWIFKQGKWKVRTV